MTNGPHKKDTRADNIFVYELTKKGEGRIHADPAPEFSTAFFAAVSTRRRDRLAA
jgi:hypothetical protein